MNVRHATAGGLSAVLLALAAPAALGQDGEDTLSFAFTTAKAKSSAGWSVEGEFPRQRVIDQLTITLPAGTKVDTKAVKRCSATQEQIDSSERGVADACPAASKVGSGKGTAYLGDGADPVTFDLGVYNTSTGALLDIVLGGRTAFTSPITITGRKHVIELGLTPSLNARIVAFELDVKKAGSKRKPYVRTPATCPRNRKLTATVSAREHGAGSTTTSDTTSCRR